MRNGKLFASAAALGLLAIACSGAPSARPYLVEVETPRFDGVHYPVPDSLPVQLQPPPMLPDDPRLAVAAALPTVPWAQAPDLHNAAIRDREIEIVARRYLQSVEQLYRIVRHMGAGGALADPLALRKWHADGVVDMGQLIEEAAALEATFVDLAHETGVDLGGPMQERGRPGRIRLLFRMTACVRRDLAERTHDGLDSADARRRGVDEADLRAALTADPAEIEKHMDETIRQTSATLACAQLVGRVLGGP